MRNFVRLASGLNINPLLLQVYSHSELFGKDKIRATYSVHSPHSAVDDILIRWPKESESIGDDLQCSWQDSSKSLSASKDISFALMTAHRGEQLGRVMVTRLAPGKSITPHKDTEGAYANFYTRFHIPLQSDPGVTFNCGEESVNMKPGEVWWFNGHEIHSVVNNSAMDRLNLIVDIRT